jgi:hypothetical protein
MNESHGQSKTQGLRRKGYEQNLSTDPNSSKTSGTPSTGVRSQFSESAHRKNCPRRNRVKNVTGKLIEDTRKQLVKANECIVWYQNEAEECKEKLQRLDELKALEEQEEQAEYGFHTACDINGLPF